jgi:hypothetical protein
MPGCNLMLEKLLERNFHKLYVCKKYATKRFLKASVYAIEWAYAQLDDPEWSIESEGIVFEEEEEDA